jgi:hypothetical protein
MNKVLLFVLLATCFTAKAQEEQKKEVKKISFNDIYFHAGFFSIPKTDNISDFKLLAPKSFLLNNNDLSGYTYDYDFIFNLRVLTSSMAGIKFRNKEKTGYRTNSKVRLGLSYLFGTGFTTSIHKNEIQRLDSTINQFGYKVYNDSIYRKSYSMVYSSNQLRFEASVIFQSSSEKRWSIFGGIGFTTGASLNAHTYIFYGHSSHIQRTNEWGGYDSSSSYRYFNVSENYKNRNNFAFSIFAPYGIDFKIGKRSELWKHIHVYYELRPVLDYIVVPELGTISDLGLQTNLGLRFSFDD